MNILQLANKLPYPPKDGGALATLNLTKGLSALGHKVTVLALSTSKHPGNIDDFPEEVLHIANFRIIHKDTGISGMKAVGNLLFSKLPYNLERFWSEKLAAALKEILMTGDFDVIQLEGLSMALYIPVIKESSDTRIVMRAHNAEYKIWERQADNLKPGLRKSYFRSLVNRLKRFEKRNFCHYDALVPISPADLKIFKDLGFSGATHVAPFGVDHSFSEEENEIPDFPSLFFIGALDWIPNQEGLMWFVTNVWKDLRASHPELVFYVAGRNAPHWLSKQLAKEAVDFKGEVDDAREFMIPKAIMVVPLFSGSGLRIKIIEGMALKKTVITTSMGAEGLEGKNGEHYLIADDARTFISRIEQVINDWQMYNQIGLQARRFIKENFNNLAICHRLTGFYKSLLK